MSKLRVLRALVSERLSAAADEIFALVETTIAEYEEELRRSREENQRNQRNQRLPDPSGAGDRAAVQSRWFSPEPSINEEKAASPRIKEEAEEPSVKQEEESLPEFTAVCVKSEEPSSLLRLRQTEAREKEEQPARAQGHFPSRADPQTDRSSDTDDDEDWEAPAAASTARTETEEHGERDEQTPRKRKGAGGEILECPFCQKGFTTKHNLETHTRVHTGEKTYRCPICRSSFVRKCSLKAHARTHRDGNLYRCSVCARAFPQLSSLTQHYRTHTGEKPYSCSVCNNRFTQHHHLTEHMRTHTGERPYSCSVCGKAFARSFTLKIHHRQHKSGQDAQGGRLSLRLSAAQRESGVSAPGAPGHASANATTQREGKLYCCSVCGRTFSQLSSLTQHNRTHTGEKPYSCSVCNNRFTQQHHLTEHMRIHTGERPYSCSVCGKTFARSFTLKIHMKTHGAAPCSSSAQTLVFSPDLLQMETCREQLQGLDERNV
ncbi:hypothetical protein NL108_016864 [Boleophthalmus pectinirostris]|uniref:zinc finger protein 501-like n=1 Tax=Boleophthalmus pectinirostris TaxID=150288 RepID=UPI002431E339|nr:zinc finger protein 501-like [Boleophthalmus pectinirostris]KAJ0065706.1 hypothetical protein NL108_016864 [Boleophthalmus pectinirostris]